MLLGKRTSRKDDDAEIIPNADLRGTGCQFIYLKCNVGTSLRKKNGSSVKTLRSNSKAIRQNRVAT